MYFQLKYQTAYIFRELSFLSRSSKNLEYFVTNGFDLGILRRFDLCLEWLCQFRNTPTPSRHDGGCANKIVLRSSDDHDTAF